MQRHSLNEVTFWTFALAVFLVTVMFFGNGRDVTGAGPFFADILDSTG